MLAQIPGTRGVLPFFLRLAVLTAVELDNQALLDAAEVRKVRTKWVVATKLEAVEALGSQMSPQFSFLVGRVGTKPSATVTRAFYCGDLNRAPRKAR